MEIVTAEPEAVQIQNERAEVVVDINQEILISSMSKKLDDRKRPKESRAGQCTIYKVPDEIKKVDPRAYEPRIVSIGPFHHGKEKLLPMEDIKWQFLDDLIGRDPSNSLDKYITVVSNPTFVKEIAKCYSVQVIGADGVNAFVETMVLDGCFIIEFLLKSYGSSMGELDEGSWKRSLVENDLLLFENQIPFSVLQVLYDLTRTKLRDMLTLSGLAMFCLWDTSKSLPPVPLVIHHLLHLHHSWCLPTPTDELQSWIVKQVICEIIHMICKALFCRTPLCEDHRAPRRLPSATELYNAGISFERKRRSGILDVTFRASDGVMEIPLLFLDSIRVSELRNMVLFEQLLPAVGNHFTSFVALMQNFIETPADAATLVKSGVLVDQIDGDGDVVRFFNTLGKGMFLNYNEFYYWGLFKDVNKYCAEKRHRWRASFMHTYFSNPWSAISLFGAILLLLLTILQTFFTIFPRK